MGRRGERRRRARRRAKNASAKVERKRRQLLEDLDEWFRYPNVAPPDWFRAVFKDANPPYSFDELRAAYRKTERSDFEIEIEEVFDGDLGLLEHLLDEQISNASNEQVETYFDASEHDWDADW